jgi:hypothetical protein
MVGPVTYMYDSPIYTNCNWMEIVRDLDDDLNLRRDAATRGKCCIFGWEGRGVDCGYSRLQGGSPRLCWLRTIRSGTLSKYLNCTGHMLALGIAWKTCTQERWDPDQPYDIIAKVCHTWPVYGRARVIFGRFIPLQGCLLILIWVIAFSLSPLIEMHFL